MTNPNDRLPPHSVEAEQGVLGCLLLDPKAIPACDAALRGRSDGFYDLRHRALYEALQAMHRSGESIDVLTVSERLKDDGELDRAGGLVYLASLPDLVPSAANLPSYTAILREKLLLRQLLQATSRTQERVFTENGSANPAELLARVSAELRELQEASQDAGTESAYVWSGLRAVDTTHDENTLVGVREDGTTSRYLCRGGSCWIIGPSGIGKSSLGLQFAACWALGRSVFGITPHHPLRVLYVQAENDEGDLAEQTHGLSEGLGIEEFGPDEETLDRNLRIVTEGKRTGAAFCDWLERQILAHKAELVFVDPFLSFAGIDVSKQDQCTLFLRNLLNPILRATGACVVGVHHTGKPKEKAAKDWTINDWAYAMLGSSELANWARAIMVLQPAGDYSFRLRLSKREKRSGAHHLSGEPTSCLWLRHSDRGICWEQVEEPQEVPDEDPAPPQKQESKPNKVGGMNLATFLSGCPKDGETAMDIRRRLSIWLSSDESPERMAVEAKSGTMKRIIEELVRRGKLDLKNGDRYVKGPQA